MGDKTIKKNLSEDSAMKDRITCFKLNWYDCGLSCAECVVQEEITVYRNDCYIVFKELNGYGVICRCDIIHIEKDKVNDFFESLEKTADKWQNDYKVQVCDGSAWQVRMWHSSHKVKKVCGTVKYPPSGRKIEKYIRSFIMDSKSIIAPKIFGCGS